MSRPGITGHTPPFADLQPAHTTIPLGPGSKPQPSSDILTLIADFPYNWSSESAEAKALHEAVEAKKADSNARHLWSPSVRDFNAVISGGQACVGVTGFFSIMQNRARSSIRILNLVGHGDRSNIGLAGRVVTDRTENVAQGEIRGDTFFTSTIVSGDLTPNSQWGDFIVDNTLWDRFVEGGEIILMMCNTGTNIGLVKEMADAFRVKVNAFSKSIFYCPTFDSKPPPKMVDRKRVGHGSCDPVEDSLTKLSTDRSAKPKPRP